MNVRRFLYRWGRVARAGVGMAMGMLAYPIAWLGWFRPRDELAAAVGQLLLVGFYGASRSSPSARLLARQAQRGQVGAVFFVHQNVGSLAQVKGLLDLFRDGGTAPLLAIDHEGGIVQRLTDAHGMSRLPAARDVAASLSPDEAYALYARAGRELAALGFDINLGPVVDIDAPDNPAIGVFGRAYGTEPDRITAYAQAFLAGFSAAGILCAAKHFPGHGLAVSDSHEGAADISATWTEAELEPFARLIASPTAPPLMMMGHLRLDPVAPDGRPATISTPIVTGLLRRRLGYQGVVVTDDLDMKAVSDLMGRKEAVVQAIAAGCDLLMFKNLFGYDPLLPQRAVRWVRDAIARGELSEAQVMAAAQRVRALRSRARPSG
ncbi:MAG: glycoside hydrolase family 3 N-terminal domain-containing protein [Hydrogenophaga sp.]|uniref:glycoside hydrolase family 3 protein n=1 Tax=Hydrogenophaga sp. TaxID=1904254 RepID=UPI002604027F|nr:glycoside hydrolase family 3 N-terminal domain-containing protein [Hydrogenophaga sp.]MDD3785809.1 glycoside hydrolase family 3 N-terminal domain-containing protein [Hydrogenophaga sp.]